MFSLATWYFETVKKPHLYTEVRSSKLWDFYFFNVVFGAAYWQPNPTEKCCSQVHRARVEAGRSLRSCAVKSNVVANASSTPHRLCHFGASYLISEPVFLVLWDTSVPQVLVTYHQHPGNCSSDYYINVLQIKTLRPKDAKLLAHSQQLSWTC